MRAFIILAIAAVGYAAPAADPQILQSGLPAGPLTAAFGDLVATPKGLRSLALEGFSEDLNQDGFVDPIGQAVAAPLYAAPAVLPYALPAPVAVKPAEVKLALPAATYALPAATYALPALHTIAAPIATHTYTIPVATKTETIHLGTHVSPYGLPFGLYGGLGLPGLPIVAAAPAAEAEAEAAVVAEE